MNSAAAFDVKGWCPGALRPMQSGDGLIVRVRPRCGTLSVNELEVLACAAGRFGNGHIDLTRRANLQIRGVSEASLQGLHEAIGALGLLDADPDSEAVRNVMVSPLAGIDPAEVLDVRPIARALERLLISDPAIRALPSKFGFIIDGGGTVTLKDSRADIRLVAIREGREPVIAFGLDGPTGVEWLGSVSPAAAAAVAIDTARAFLSVTSKRMRRRMRELSADALASLRSAIGARFNPVMRSQRPTKSRPDRRIGLLDLGLGRFAVAIATPFGRIETDQLCKLTGEMTALGVKEVRLSPWRTLYMAIPGTSEGQGILDTARAAGLITDPGDPMLRIEACPGAPACRSTSLDIRGDARRLAVLLSQYGFAGTVHVSGCAKGCAKSGASDLVLVGAEGRYGIVRHGTAQDCPASHVSFSELAADPGAFFDREGCRHG